MHLLGVYRVSPLLFPNFPMDRSHPSLLGAAKKLAAEPLENARRGTSGACASTSVRRFEWSWRTLLYSSCTIACSEWKSQRFLLGQGAYQGHKMILGNVWLYVKRAKVATTLEVSTIRHQQWSLVTSCNFSLFFFAQTLMSKCLYCNKHNM